MRSRLIGGLALALALAVPGAWAQWQGGPGGDFDPPMGRQVRAEHHPGLGMMRWLNDPAFRERVGITPEQADKLRAQATTTEKAMVRTRADEQIKHIELRELLQADKPDRAAIDKKLRELADLHYAAMKVRTDNELAMRELLTPEQREKIQAFARERMREFGGMRGGPRMGQRPQRGPEGPGGPMPPAAPKPMPQDE